MHPQASAIDDMLTHEVRPALATHGGSVVRVEAADGGVALRLTGSCGSCYFRQGCIENLVKPSVKQFLGANERLSIR